MMSLSTHHRCASAELLHVGMSIYTMNLHLGEGQPESTMLLCYAEAHAVQCWRYIVSSVLCSSTSLLSYFLLYYYPTSSVQVSYYSYSDKNTAVQTHL